MDIPAATTSRKGSTRTAVTRLLLFTNGPGWARNRVGGKTPIQARKEDFPCLK